MSTNKKAKMVSKSSNGKLSPRDGKSQMRMREECLKLLPEILGHPLQMNTCNMSHENGENEDPEEPQPSTSRIDVEDNSTSSPSDPNAREKGFKLFVSLVSDEVTNRSVKVSETKLLHIAEELWADLSPREQQVFIDCAAKGKKDDDDDISDEEGGVEEAKKRKKGKSCGRSKDDNDEDDEEDGVDKAKKRKKGKSCGRSKDDNDEDDEEDGVDKAKKRKKGKSCGRSKDDNDKDDEEDYDADTMSDVSVSDLLAYV